MQFVVNGHTWTVKDLTGEHRRYVYSDDETLRDVYGRYSRSKESAYRRCRELFDGVGGECFRIASANTFQFSVGFEFTNESDGSRWFAYITKAYDYAMRLD